MSPADPRNARPAARGRTLAAALATLTAVAALFAVILLAVVPVAVASPAGSGLAVAMDRSLTRMDESAALIITGDALAAPASGATIEVTIAGPAALTQITQPDASLAKTTSFTVAVDSLPAVARPSASQIHLPIPTTSLPLVPGAYGLTVSLSSGGAPVATGSTWMGRVATRSSALDLAFVWRAELGIHRDPQGRFIDNALEEACADGGPLPAVAGLGARFPDLRFSLGVEPVLLTQLRDMADGFTRADGSPTGAAVAAGDPAATAAKAVLSNLVKLSESNNVEMATSVYAGADLGLLAGESWRDGFAQMQMGKQELVQTLGLGLPPAGAYAPGLTIAADSLGAYGQASIDHVLVDASVAADLNEKVAAGTVAVRAHDQANDRLTLVFADSALRRLIAPPWDPAVLFAGIAAVLASGDRDALVLAQGPDFTLPPQTYLDAVGQELAKDSWIRTETMSDLLRAHPPDARPVLLGGQAAQPSGYIAQTLFSVIRSAHGAIDDLATGADPASLSLEVARRSLYTAESRWWYRPEATPDEASAGLGYAVQAENAGKDALGKIRITGVKDRFIFGHDGEVTVTARNDGDSVVMVDLHLAGEGLRFPGGEVVKVRLEQGANDIAVPVTGSSSSRTLTARLVLGRSALGEQSASLRFLTVAQVLPWAALAVALIILVVVTAIVLSGRRKRRRPR
jgi:hypothetical protein